ncbi:MAG: ferredoxin family protein [Deltaproteobacteria bacterium]|nr:ferredoxin family protein [Deltaproteobacteria bacterium]
MKSWLGTPREEVPWYPTIDAVRCTGCRGCIDFCRNDVLEFDEGAGKTVVKNPSNCVVECSACARLCPEKAITFPDEKTWAAFIKDRLSRK